jgi:hypothetical protein
MLVSNAGLLDPATAQSSVRVSMKWCGTEPHRTAKNEVEVSDWRELLSGSTGFLNYGFYAAIHACQNKIEDVVVEIILKDPPNTSPRVTSPVVTGRRQKDSLSWVIMENHLDQLELAAQAEKHPLSPLLSFPKNYELPQAEKAHPSVTERDPDSSPARPTPGQPTGKETKAVIESDGMKTKFAERLNVSDFPKPEDLKRNPYVFKENVIGIKTTFKEMSADQEGVFSDAVVSNLPNTPIREGAPVVIALKVAGLKPVRVSGMEVSLPYGTYVGLYACKQDSCADFFEQE